MKTTLNLNDGLLAEARALAARQHTSLTRLIEEGLQLRLHGAATPVLSGPLQLPVFDGRSGRDFKALLGRSQWTLLVPATPPRSA